MEVSVEGGCDGHGETIDLQTCITLLRDRRSRDRPFEPTATHGDTQNLALRRYPIQAVGGQQRLGLRKGLGRKCHTRHRSTWSRTRGPTDAVPAHAVRPTRFDPLPSLNWSPRRDNGFRRTSNPGATSGQRPASLGRQDNRHCMAPQSAHRDTRGCFSTAIMSPNKPGGQAPVDYSLQANRKLHDGQTPGAEGCGWELTAGRMPQKPHRRQPGLSRTFRTAPAGHDLFHHLPLSRPCRSHQVPSESHEPLRQTAKHECPRPSASHRACTSRLSFAAKRSPIPTARREINRQYRLKNICVMRAQLVIIGPVA